MMLLAGRVTASRLLLVLPIVGVVGGDIALARDFFVTTAAELTTALEESNADPDPDRIALAQGVYDISQPLQISGSLILEGEGASETVVSAGGRDYRVVNILPGADVTFRQVTISDGRALGGASAGGGIQNLGRLRLDDVTVRDNGAHDGGGIASFHPSDTVILNSRILANHATGSGGGVHASGSTMEIRDTVIENNSATRGGGGIAAVGVSETGIFASRIVGNVTTQTPPPPLARDFRSRGGGLAVLDGLNGFRGAMTVLDTRIEANSALHGGGGVYNEGTMSLERVTVTENTTTGSGCADLAVPEGVRITGGGIDNQDALEIQDSEILDNVNEAGCGGGLANHGRRSRLVADSVLVRANRGAKGGGIYNNGYLELLRSRIWQNDTGSESLDQGGGIFVEGSESDTIVSDSEIRGNDNGAIINEGNLRLLRVGINRNLAKRRGSAIFNGYGASRIRVSESAIFGNSFPGTNDRCPFDCFAVENHGELDFINVTVAFNSGGMRNEDFGRARLTNVTITGNSGNQLAHEARTDANGETRLKNTIIAKALANGTNCSISNARRGTFFSDGFNLSDDESCGFAEIGDLNGVHARLTGQLSQQDPPRTHYDLLADSPAVDAIPAEECFTTDGLRIDIDQRGEARPRGRGCDIGAIER